MGAKLFDDLLKSCDSLWSCLTGNSYLKWYDSFFPVGLDIESSLKQLAERRTDIFGVEETAIGKKIGEEEIQKPEEKVE